MRGGWGSFLPLSGQTPQGGAGGVLCPCLGGFAPTCTPGGLTAALCRSAGAAGGERGAEDGADQNHRDAGQAGEGWGGRGVPAWGGQPRRGTDPQFSPRSGC